MPNRTLWRQAMAEKIAHLHAERAGYQLKGDEVGIEHHDKLIDEYERELRSAVYPRRHYSPLLLIVAGGILAAAIVIVVITTWQVSRPPPAGASAPCLRSPA